MICMICGEWLKLIGFSFCCRKPSHYHNLGFPLYFSAK